ncbi:MAG: radical SAM protein [Candidatus Altiarchaeota archaeon]
MDAALVLTPAWHRDTPPLSTGYLAAVLRDAGFTAKTFDLNMEVEESTSSRLPLPYLEGRFMSYLHPEFFEPEDDDARLHGTSESLCERWCGRILDDDPNVIGFSTYYNTLLTSLMLAKKIREEDDSRIIVFGGPEADRHNNGRFIAHTGWVDYTVPQEGELILPEIVGKARSGFNAGPIAGTIVNQDGKVVDFGDGPIPLDLDSLPYPDFSDNPVEGYRISPMTPIVSSRGCVGRCVFCGERPFFRCFRQRSVEDVVCEMEHQVDAHDVCVFHFNDSMMNADQQYLSRLCTGIIDSGLDVAWGGNARADKLDSDMITSMYDSGCRFLLYGIESGSQRVLGSMKKDISIVDAEKVLEKTHDSGIFTHTYMITGFPTETNEDFEESMLFLERNKKYIDSAQANGFYMPLNSDMMREHEKYGIGFHEDRLEYPRELEQYARYFRSPHPNWSVSGYESTTESRSNRYWKMAEYIKENFLQELQLRNFRKSLMRMGGR